MQKGSPTRLRTGVLNLPLLKKKGLPGTGLPGTGLPGTGLPGTGLPRPGYRGPGYRGPGYRGPGYRGPGYRGPGYRGPSYRGPGYRPRAGLLRAGTEGRVTEGRVTEGRVTEGQLTVEDIQEWVDGHLSETPLPFEIQQVGKHCWPAWSKHWDLDLAGAIVVWTKTEASRRKLGPSGHRLDSGQASFAPKLRAPDPPQAAFDLFTSTSRQTTSASQVTYARKSGLTPRILIYRVENGSDEHS